MPDGVMRVPDLRERRRLETCAAISDKAVELFEARGVGGVTVDQIAEAAGVSPRTFFRYFRSKEDAALTSYIAFAGRIMSWLETEAGEDDLLASLESAIQQSMDEVDRDASSRERLLRLWRLLDAEPALQAAATHSDLSAVREFARRLVSMPGASLQESQAYLISSMTVTVASLAMREWAGADRDNGASASLGRTYAGMREASHRLFGNR